LRNVQNISFLSKKFVWLYMISIILIASVCPKFMPYYEFFNLFSSNFQDVTSFAHTSSGRHLMPCRFTLGRHWAILSFWRYCNKCSIFIRQSVTFCWTAGRSGLHGSEASDAACSEIMELTLPWEYRTRFLDNYYSGFITFV
jgi:hypothetical protein